MNRLTWLLAILLLSGCSANPPQQPQIVTVDRFHYPDLADIPYPAALHLRVCEWKKPRVMNQLVPIPGEKWNGKSCSDFSDKERLTSAYIENCPMENPIDTSSNIIYGFDAEGWRCFQENMKAIRNLIKEYRTRLEQVNKQRAKWRKNNEDSKAKDTKKTESKSN